MSLPLSKIFDSLERNIPIERAFVVLYHEEDGIRRLREADIFGESNREIIKMIKERKKILDPKREDDKRKFLIVFYGTKDMARKWLKYESSPDVDDEVSFTKQSTSKSDNNIVTRKTKLSSQCLSNQEITESISSLTQMSANILEQLKEIKNEYKEIKSTFSQQYEKKETKALGMTPEQALLQRMSRKIAEVRLDFKNLETKVNKINFAVMGVDEEGQEKIKDSLLYETRIPKMLGTIARELFGEKLKTHILGRHGVRERDPRKHERQFTISRHDEDDLRKILSVYNDIFLTERAWKAVVQYVINQKGRDEKKPRIKRSHHDSTSDEEPRNKKEKQSLDKEDNSASTDMEVQSPKSAPVNYTDNDKDTGSE